MSKTIQVALSLHQMHIDRWWPNVASRHSHWTRAEKKRVYAAIKERDCAFVSHYLMYCADATSIETKVTGAIILFTYLTQAQYLIVKTKLREAVLNKMDEFETIALKSLQEIHSIQDNEEYRASITLRDLHSDLLFVMNNLRMIMAC